MDRDSLGTGATPSLRAVLQKCFRKMSWKVLATKCAGIIISFLHHLQVAVPVVNDYLVPELVLQVQKSEPESHLDATSLRP